MRALFGARAQIVVGVQATLVAIGVWIWYLLHPITVGAVFHISMYFGVVACYCVIATALGYRATERVEAVVADVEHADTVVEN